MKTYFPHYFKKIGIMLVIIGIVLSFIANINGHVEGFAEGFNSVKQGNEQQLQVNNNIISKENSETLTWISLAFSFSGLFIYMFSKEKVEDEFIQNLRYKSLAKSLIYTWVILVLVYIFRANFTPERIEIHYKTDGLYVLQFQLFMYVIIYNYYKKWKFE